MNEGTRWSQVKVIFDESIRLSAGRERELYLDKVCGSDTELRHELESLLKTYDSDSEFLEIPARNDAGALLSAHLADRQIDHEIGPYLIIRRVGEGGMGVVYEGVRIDGQFQQRVAIKLVKRGMDSEYILRRFRNERQILAGLAHPNIARLLDGGATPEGSPYFVMEFIEGKLIDDYCNSSSLDLPKRVDLVRQIADAVAYAHNKQIIHRDIKPGNILVEGSGTPKLLDFGIAKLLTGDAAHTQTLTVTELLIVTPDYASPEQSRGDPATKQSDIYSLGAVLYELASGEKAKTLSAEGLRHLPRSLQLIIQRAMHPDPGHRYAEIAGFEADLDHYLRGESVSARPDSRLYRTAQAVRRHATTAWIVALITVASLSAFVTFFIPRASSSGRKSVAVVELQNTSGASSTTWLGIALSEMLSTELAAGDKIRTLSGDAVARMKADLGLQPSGTYSPASLLKIANNLHPDYVLAGSYLATGGDADLLLRIDLHLQDVKTGDSIATWTDTGTPSDLPAMATRAGARLREALGAKSAGSTVFTKMASPESQRLYAEGLARMRSYDPAGARARFERVIAENPNDPLGHAALADALASLGYSQRAADEAKLALNRASGFSARQRLEVQATYDKMRWNWPAAIADYSQLWRQFPDNLDYAFQLASVETKGGNVPAARKTITEIRQRTGNENDARADLAEALAADSVGDSRLELDFGKKAEAKARQAGQIQLLAQALYDQAWALWFLGDFGAAERAYAEGIRFFTQAGNQLLVVDMKSTFAALLLDEGKPQEAAALLQEQLAVAKKLGHPSLESTVSNNLAECWEALGELKKAQNAYEESFAVDKELNLKASMPVSVNNVAGVLKEQGKFDAAIQKSTEALALAREVGKKSSIAIALNNLADAHLAQGHLAEAEKEAAASLAVAQEINRKTSIAAALAVQASILRAQHKWKMAEAKFTEASHVATASKLAEIRVQQAQLFADQGRLEEAAKLVRTAVAAYQKEKNPTGQAWSSAVLAQVLIREGKIKQAAQLIPTGPFEDFETRTQIAKARAMLTQIRPRPVSVYRAGGSNANRS